MPALDDLLEALLALHPKRIDLSLGRIERLLAALGHPEKRLPPVIHVAGTNGKGSVVAFLRAILEASGRTAHVYTSPHLVRFNERIRLGAEGGGRLVETPALIAAIEEVLEANDNQPITFFEITTAVAFRLFAEHPADFSLIEVGLGGRYDATNVIADPLAAVLTSISHDHAEFLGDDLAGIASEKAGIMKPGAPAIVGPQDEHVMAMLAVEAEAARASLFRHNMEWGVHAENARLVYQDERGLIDLPLPRLVGQHQIDNAGTAIATLRALGLDLAPTRIDNETMGRGLRQVRWPARLQRLSEGPLVDAAPEGAELWLDGGHNPAAGIVIADEMAALHDRVQKPLFLVAGMLTTKDPIGYFASFESLAQHVFTVPVQESEAGFEPRELAAAANEAGLPARAAASVGEALAFIEEMGGEPPRILICGSLYLAGEVLRENGPLPE
ncbi:folylpolyglutamate synthase/dihydrofolate synthase family protein [Afifella sp. IM 167]|uniref:bifunctional folylpolyglutamate synthase/dihydrofolate synthase n=1 Tax=Afifella sp. IM 167 TaxID=2033586 RepID=UPI001CCAB273|nr:folylpolyglutamate synthase/dihydrofolate synthase family protein [Afifella sp. IM 167]MBZ8133608.1 bifunctional folylpolyglutamate synthase/dihydrofolate synthase [Afifella sp. IM 167]